MRYTLTFYRKNHDNWCLNSFLNQFDLPLQLAAEGSDGSSTYHYLFLPDSSVTCFEIAGHPDGRVDISVDGLASQEDYRILPYLADSLHVFLNGDSLKADGGKSVYSLYDEAWMEHCIGEEIAMVKAALTVAPRYYPMLPLNSGCISLELLADYGVGLGSATPRIYGYLQYLMRNKRLTPVSEQQMQEDYLRYGEEIMADVPQHVSIGKVKSWQKDGSETWESFSQQDVDLLLALAEKHQKGGEVAAVVLNDIGTIWQAGIGVQADAQQAAFWYGEAILLGDRTFAPANLGDLYRKGGGNLPPSLPKALEAYRLCSEPYAQYRIGQAYEEGWNGITDLTQAMHWYRRSAEAGHHLAIRRLNAAGSGQAFSQLPESHSGSGRHIE